MIRLEHELSIDTRYRISRWKGSFGRARSLDKREIR